MKLKGKKGKGLFPLKYSVWVSPVPHTHHLYTEGTEEEVENER